MPPKPKARPPKEVLIVELPAPLKQDLRRIADLEGESVSHVIRRLIRDEARRVRADQPRTE